MGFEIEIVQNLSKQLKVWTPTFLCLFQFVSTVSILSISFNVWKHQINGALYFHLFRNIFENISKQLKHDAFLCQLF